jgi:hypothetical protein
MAAVEGQRWATPPATDNAERSRSGRTCRRRCLIFRFNGHAADVVVVAVYDLRAKLSEVLKISS